MSNENSHLLEEYKELGLCWRHDDEVFSKLTAVLLPLSIAALTLPYLRAGTPKLLAAAGGLMLMTFWFFSSKSHKGRSEIRFSRIHEIERILGFDSHLRYHRERAKNVLKDQRLRCCMFIVYLLIALLVTCDIKVEATDPKVAHSVAQFIRALFDTKVEAAFWTIDVWPPFGLWSNDAWIIKLVVTTETIIVSPVAIVVIVVIAVWIWRWIGIGWRYCKRCCYDKRLKRSPKEA